MSKPTEFTGPHKYPQSLIGSDAWIISWECAACGEWVSEYGPQRDDCTVDWRGARLPGIINRLAEALGVDL